MYPSENLTARVFPIQHHVISKAAKEAGKTLSEYMTDVLFPWACSDLGIPIPELPKLGRGETSRIIREAAKQAQMTTAEFERYAAETVAAKSLGLPTPDDVRAPTANGRSSAQRKGPPSGTRKMATVGGYAKPTSEVTETRSKPRKTGTR